MIKISKDHPGGNIQVNRIDGSVVYLEQEIRDSSEWWFYWNFRVEAAEGDFTFVFENGEVVGPYGPAISNDGINWYYDKDAVFLDHRSFRFHFTQKNPVCYFAFSIPYIFSDFQAFYDKISDHKLCVRQSIATSEKNREIPLLRIGNTSSKKHIFFTCRHHACEANASYALEGIIAYLLQGQGALAREYLFHVIPFIDIDGVEEGDQGKMRRPHDHNRDYTAEPIYNITKNFKRYLEEHPPLIGFDLHCPWKWGDLNDILSIVQHEPPYREKELQFSHVLEKVMSAKAKESPIKYRAANNLAFGQGWNRSVGADAARNFYKYGAHLAFTLEIPYFGNEAVPTYLPPALRELGRRFAMAMEEYLCQYGVDFSQNKGVPIL